MDAPIPTELLPLLTILRRAYPHGVPDADQLPLLTVLGWDMSFRQRATLVSALLGADRFDVEHAAAGLGRHAAGLRGDVLRVRDHVVAHGWVFDVLRYDELVAMVPQVAVVRIVAGDHVDWHDVARTPDVVRVTEPRDIAALVEALRFDQPLDHHAATSSPDLTFGFVADGGGVLEEIAHVGPGRLRHPTWPGDQPLLRPDDLTRWLVDHGRPH